MHGPTFFSAVVPPAQRARGVQPRRQDKFTLSCQDMRSHGERMKLASKKKG